MWAESTRYSLLSLGSLPSSFATTLADSKTLLGIRTVARMLTVSVAPAGVMKEMVPCELAATLIRTLPSTLTS